MNAAYGFLSAETWIGPLLLVGGLVDLPVIAAVPVPSILLGTSSVNAGPFAWINILTLACALWVTTSVTVLVTGVATVAALIRADGGVPTARATLAAVWARRWPLAAWALVSAAVWVLVSLLIRFGLAGIVVEFPATIGCAVVAMFAVAIVMSRGTMPAATVRQSAGMVRASFGTVARGGVKLAAPWIRAVTGAMLETFASSFVLLEADAHPYGILAFVGLFCIGAGVLFGVGVVTTGRAAYLNTILYRIAAGHPELPGLWEHLPTRASAYLPEPQ